MGVFIVYVKKDVSLITFYILRKKWVSNYIINNMGVFIVYVKNMSL